MDGTKEEYFFHQHINILTTQIDMLVMTCIRRRNEERLPGINFKILYQYLNNNIFGWHKRICIMTKLYLLYICIDSSRCDRILWYGRGLNQLSYVRGESRFSDHRPVYSIFIAEVELISRRIRRNANCLSSRVEVEEFLPYSRGYAHLSFF